MKHPIFLDLRNRPVVVVGGGAVAERKIASLLPTGARITVISPEATAQIRASASAGQLRFEQRRYEAGDLRGARLAYVATDDEEVGWAARREAEAAGVWLNVADQPRYCDFFAPAVARLGDLSIAISTDGVSPALAARLRAKLEREMPPGIADALERLRELRARCRREHRPVSTAREEIDAILDELFDERSE